jgi:hypothetical protein
MRMNLISYLSRTHFVDTRQDPDSLIALEEN